MRQYNKTASVFLLILAACFSLALISLPSASAVTLSAGATTPASPAIDGVQSVTLTAHPAGGTPPYTYQWYKAAGCTSAVSGATSSTYAASPVSTVTYYYKVTDSATTPATACSAGDTVTVNAAFSGGSTVTVGTNPLGTAYDPAKGEVFVVNYVAGTVSVISDSTNTVVGTVTIGASPYNAAYDPSKGEVFVVNQVGNSVSVISDSTNTVVATIPLGAGATPLGVAYDPAKGEVFVANYGAGTVSVISDATNTVVATITVGTHLQGAAYDASMGEVFVATEGTNSVSVISDATNTVVATVTVGVTPQGVVYDPAKGEVFVTRGTTAGAVSVISDATNTVVATVIVGATPSNAGYDPAKGEVFVTNEGGSTVSVISDATNTVVATVNVQSSPYSAGYDPAKGEVFVTNFGTGTVSVISDATNGVVTISPPSPTIDSGQSITLTAGPPSGTAAFSYQWYSASGCSASLISGATSSSYAASPSSTTSYYYKVTDSAYAPSTSCSAGDAVTVDPALSAGAVSPSSPALDLGQTVTLAANPSGGTAPYTYQWYKGAGCTSSLTSPSSSYLASPIATTTYYYKVTDSSQGTPNTACSAGDVVTVNPALSASATVTVGTDPLGEAYDSGKGEVFVTDYLAGTVSVISDATNAVVATVTVGTQPYNAAYDSGKGEVFVVNEGANTVSVISDATNAVVATVTVGTTPISDAYDAATGEVFVVNSAAGTVSVISDGTNTVVATITVGTHLQGAAYDPAKGEVFVASWSGSGTVYAISDATNTVVATIVVGTNPQGVVYDPARGEVFVTSGVATGIVSVISDATNTVVSTITVGATPSSDAYDPAKGEVFVTNEGGSTVSVISDATNAVVATVTVGANPYGAAYDPARGVVFVTDFGTGTVSVISDATNAVVTINPSGPTIDSGQSVTLTAGPPGGTAPYSYQWYTSSDCSTATVSGATSSTYAASPLSATTYYYKVTDSALAPSSACSAGDAVTVNAALSAGAVSPSNPALDPGQTVTLTANPSGGVAPYSYQWYSGSACASPISGQTGPTYVVSPTAPAPYSYEVTDSALSPVSQCSAGVTVAVNPPLTVLTAPYTIDSGQAASLTASPSGGSGTYASYAWYQGSCTGAVLGASPSFTTPSLTSTTGYCVLVTDSLGGTAQSTVTVTVNSALAAPIVSASPTTLDGSQSSTLSTSVSFSGGASPYTCEWLEEAPGASAYSGLGPSFACSAGDTPTVSTGALSTTGTWSFELQVRDSASPPVTSTSTAVEVTVTTLLALLTSPSTIDSGQTDTLTASPSGGSGAYSSYAWYEGSCTGAVLGASPSFTTPSLTSTTGYCVLVTDSLGGTAQSTVTVTVNPALVAPVISVSPSTVDSGQSSTLSTAASFSGGTSSYSCQWLEEAPGASAYNGLGPSFACSAGDMPTVSTGALSTTGTWSFELQVRDSASPPVTSTSTAVEVTVTTLLALLTSPSTIDSGQTDTLTASPSGGSGAYSAYAWYEGSCTGAVLGASPSFTTPSLTSTTGYCVLVTDSLGGTAQSTVTVTVNPALVAPVISVSPSTVDSGQSSTLSTAASFSGGTSSYSCQWLEAAPGASGYSDLRGSFSCAVGGAPTVSTGALSTTGTWSFELQVRDSSTAPVTVASLTFTVTVNTVLTVLISPSTVDSGQTDSLTASPSGGSGAYSSYAWYEGSCTGAVLGASPSFTTPSLTSTTGYCALVTDSLGGNAQATATVTVNPTLTAPIMSASPTTIDNGQSSTLSTAASFSGGTSPYTCQWLEEAPGASTYSGIGPSIACSAADTPTTSTGTLSIAGAWQFELQVRDSSVAPVAVTSSTVTVTVDTVLTAGAITPSSPTIDSGQSVILTASPSGGTPPFSYQWYSGSSATCSLDTTTLGAASNQSVSATTSTYYCYSVTDALTNPPTLFSSTDQVIVNPALAAGSIAPSSPTVDGGQSVTLTSLASGGTPSLSYQWYSDGTCTTPISGQTGPTYVASPSSSTTYYYRVTDSALSPASQCSAGDAVTVNPALATGAITPSAPSIDGGQSVILTASPSNGTGFYSYQWYSGSSATCSLDTTALGAASNQSVSPSSDTYYCYSVTDISTNAPAVSSSTDEVTVNPDMSSGAITPASPTIDLGQSVILVANPSGGSSPDSYQWYTGAACLFPISGQTGSTYMASPITTTTYYYEVTDQAYSPVSECSAGGTVTVDPVMTVSVPSSTVDSGQAASLTASPSGGSGTYSSYAWYEGSCTGAVLGTSPSFTTPSLASTTGYCVLVTSSLGETAQATATVTVNSALVAGVLSGSPSIVDSGQPSAFYANSFFSGGTSPYTCQVVEEVPGSSSFGDLGNSFACAPGPIVGSQTLSTTGVWSFEIEITDGSSTPVTVTTPAAIVAVDPALSVSVPPSTVDSGQAASLTASPSGGSGAYSSYAWYEGSCTGAVLGTSPSFTTPSLASTTGYCVLVTDSLGGNATTTATVMVNPSIVAPVISVIPSIVDGGQPFIFSITGSFSGGTPPYTCQPLEEVPGSATYSHLGPSFTCNAGGTRSERGLLSTTGVYSFELEVTDSSSTRVIVVSTAVQVTVDPALSVSVPSSTVDSGQAASLTASPSGGSGTYSSYAWYEGSCTGAVLGTSPSFTTPSLASTTGYCVLVTDSLGGNAQATATVTVNSALVAGVLSGSPSIVDSGQPSAFYANSFFSGGTSPYTCQVVEEVPGSSSFGDLGNSFACAPGPIVGSQTLSTTGVWSFEIEITDGSSTPVTVTTPAAIVAVNPALSVSVPPSTVDSGQAASLTASPSGGSSTYESYAWYEGSCTGAVLGTSPSFTTPSLASTTGYCVLVTDSLGGNATTTATVMVNPALNTGSISPSSQFIDPGQSVILAGNPSGGTAPYDYQWYTGAGCTTAVSGATASTYAPSPSSTTTYYVEVTDSANTPTLACSSGDAVTVSPSLSAGSITPAAPSIDLGQSIALTANPSGGIGPYTYQWYMGVGCTGPITGATGSTYSTSPSSSSTYYVQVNDSSSAGARSACSSGDAVTVNPVLSAGSIFPPAPSIDNGHSVTLTADPSDGTAPYAYQWYTSSDCSTSPIPGATGSTYSASPPSSVTTYYILVTDSSSPVAQSACSSGDSVTVTIDPAFSAGSISPSAPSIDPGQSVTLTANPSGGAAPYIYQWYTSADCSTSPISGATSSTYSASPAGTYYVLVTDSASTPVAGCSSDTVAINSALSAGAIAPLSSTIDIGQSITLTANPSGGTTPYTYQWYASLDCSASPIPGATSSIYSASPSSSTTYYAKVTDSSSAGAQSACSSRGSVIVNSAPSTGAVTPSSPFIDSGQSVTLTSNPFNGTAPYSYQWYALPGCSASPIPGATHSTYSASPSSPGTTYYVRVTDSSSAPISRCSSGDAVTIDPALSAGAIAPSSPSINSGQSVTLVANPSGGTAPYSYQWYTGAGCTSPVSGATGVTYSASPSSSTTYYVQVTDSSAAGTESICSSLDAVSVSGQSGGGGSGGTGPGPAASVIQPITLTESTGGAPLGFSVTGCDVSQSTIVGDGIPHLLNATSSCTLTITLSGGNTAAERFVFSGGSSSTTMLTCPVGTCQDASLTYYQQFLQTVSYQVNGGGSGYTAPTLNGTMFGASFTFSLTTTPTPVWFDASGQVSIQSLLAGSGPETRWMILPPSPSSLDALSSQTQLFQYFTQYSVAVSATPSGSATTSPVGQSWYNSSSTILLVAAPNATFPFSGWVSGDSDSIFTNASALVTTMTVEGPDVVTATFLGPATLSLSVDPATASTSPVAVSLSGCDTTLATLSGGSAPEQVRATAGCTITLSLPAAGAGATTRYVFSNGAVSIPVTTCAAGATCVPVSLSYYQQDLVTVSVAISGGGAPSPKVTYSTLGQSRNSSGSSPLWVDHGSQLTFGTAIASTSLSERWLLTSPSSVAAAPGANIAASYQHQFGIISSFSVTGGSEGFAAPLMTYFASGTSSSVSVPPQPGSPVWADSGSHWSITNPLPTAGSLLNDSSVVWGTDQPTNGTVSAPITASLTYSPLYRVVFEEQGLPGGSDWSVEVGSGLFSSTGNTLNALVPGTQYSWSLRQSNVVAANGTLYIPQVSSGNVTLPIQGAIHVGFSRLIPVAVYIGSPSRVNYTAVDSAFKVSYSWVYQTLSVSITPIGNETGMRLIQVDFPEEILDGTSVDSVIVTLDGVQIQNATSVQQLLSAPTGGVASYMVLVVGQDYEILVAIPHFSTHTVKFTFPNSSPLQSSTSSGAGSSTSSRTSSGTESEASSNISGTASGMSSTSSGTSTMAQSVSSSSVPPRASSDTLLYLLAGAAAVVVVLVALLFLAFRRTARNERPLV